MTLVRHTVSEKNNLKHEMEIGAPKILKSHRSHHHLHSFLIANESLLHHGKFRNQTVVAGLKRAGNRDKALIFISLFNTNDHLTLHFFMRR